VAPSHSFDAEVIGVQRLAPVMDFDGDARIFVGEEFRDPSRVRGRGTLTFDDRDQLVRWVMISFKR